MTRRLRETTVGEVLRGLNSSRQFLGILVALLLLVLIVPSPAIQRGAGGAEVNGPSSQPVPQEAQAPSTLVSGTAAAPSGRQPVSPAPTSALDRADRAVA